MVRIVAAEQAQVESFVDSLFASGHSVQVGLLVGRLGGGSARDFVFALIPTPLNDGEDPATVASSSSEGRGGGRKGGKGKPAVDSSSIQVDVEWVAEHARQVSRMLIGGMHVAGVYVFGTEGAFKNSQLVLWEVVRAVAASVSVELQGIENMDMLLLHISSSPRRLSCRSCSLESSFSSTLLKPCEWKLQKIVANLQYFSASYRFNIRIPVAQSGQPARKSIKQCILASISQEAARLKTAKVLINSLLADLDTDVRLDSSRDEPQLIELLLPLDGAIQKPDPANGRKIDGFISLSGAVSARAIGYTKESLSRVISYLKDDIIASLRSRLELLCEEAEQSLDGSENAKGSPLEQLLRVGDSAAASDYTCCALPQRVFIPWQDGAVVCDYLLPNETLEDVKDRCRELFGMNHLQICEIQEPELLASMPARSAPHIETNQHLPKPSKDESVLQSSDGIADSVSRPNTKQLESISYSFLLAAVSALFLSFVLAFFWAR